MKMLCAIPWLLAIGLAINVAVLNLQGEQKDGLISAEKNSFKEVAAHLDPGGSLYLYLGTEQWLEGASQKVSDWRHIVLGIPEVKEDARVVINQAFDLISRLIKNSGVEEISGVGISGIAIERGLYRTKFILHHYKDRNSGCLWSLFGKTSHSLSSLDFLPAKTGVAGFGDLDLPRLWSSIQQEAAQSGIQKIQEVIGNLPGAFEKATGLKLDEVLASLGGELGLILTLDEERKISLPLPTGQVLEIPEPCLLLAIKVKNDLVFDRLDQLLKENPQAVSVDQEGLKMRTLPLPLPLPLSLRPTVARSGDYLFIASTEAIIQEVLAVKGGQKPGLKSTPEFKRLAQGIPHQGVSFSYVGKSFGQLAIQLQKLMFQLTARNRPGQPSTEWMTKLIRQEPQVFFGVTSTTDEGRLTIGNGSQNPAVMLVAPVVAIPALMAAIALPAFAKARETAQKTVCIANMKQIDSATEMWALENKKTSGSPVAENDIKPFLKGQALPRCPAGGTYTIGPVGTKPRCSRHGPLP